MQNKHYCIINSDKIPNFTKMMLIFPFQRETVPFLKHWERNNRKNTAKDFYSPYYSFVSLTILYLQFMLQTLTIFLFI